jgi:hypothetical protein
VCLTHYSLKAEVSILSLHAFKTLSVFTFSSELSQAAYVQIIEFSEKCSGKWPLFANHGEGLWLCPIVRDMMEMR